MKPNKMRNVFCLLSSARGNRSGPEFSLAHLPTIPCFQLVALNSDCAVRTIVIIIVFFFGLFVFLNFVCINLYFEELVGGTRYIDLMVLTNSGSS